MSDYQQGAGQDYNPNRAQEEFEASENKKYQLQVEEEEAKKLETERLQAEAKAKEAAPTTTDKAVKGGKGDYSWGGHEDQKKAADADGDGIPDGNQTPMVKALENIVHTGAAPALGVGDFISDTLGLVPWLKPADEWWDKNSPRSDHPVHKVIRDASSVIIPTMWGGGAITGSLRAATAARSIPQATRVLGTIAAHAGVDTTVTAISSHSKEQDNIARTLNDWLGWDIPWATRDSDSPDVIRKKNVYESAGLSVGVDLIQAAFSLGKVVKAIPVDEAAEKTLAK